jgi:hypothetical protein
LCCTAALAEYFFADHTETFVGGGARILFGAAGGHFVSSGCAETFVGSGAGVLFGVCFEAVSGVFISSGRAGFFVSVGARILFGFCFGAADGVLDSTGHSESGIGCSAIPEVSVIILECADRPLSEASFAVSAGHAKNLIGRRAVAESSLAGCVLAARILGVETHPELFYIGAPLH